MQTISVLIPTWKRHADLDRCLRALCLQELRPDEVIVVWRQDDHPARDLAASFANKLPMRILEVDRPGQVAALNRGIEAATGDIVAITDDDAAPHPCWTRRIADLYRNNPRCVGAGGRDIVHEKGGVIPPADVAVGVLHWYGKAEGNHHRGSGAARPVRFLKGANCSFLRSAAQDLRFDERLLGRGAQTHNDLGFTLALSKRGEIWYDPIAAVDHFPAERHDEDRRGIFNHEAWTNACHNYVLVILDHLGTIGRITFFPWLFLVGTTDQPGMLQCVRYLPRWGLFGAVQRWRGLVLGAIAALRHNYASTR